MVRRRRVMRPVSPVAAVFLLGLPSLAVAADHGPAVAGELAAMTAKLARNQESLLHFCWDTQIEIRIKGQAPRTRVDLCRYGPDGAVYRTPPGAPVPRAEVWGLRRRGAGVKADPLEDSIEAAVTLAHLYQSPPHMRLKAPPGGAHMLVFGKPGSNVMELRLESFAKPGDVLVLGFDSETMSLRTIEATSYLAGEADAVTLHGVFQSLPDGTSYVASSVLNAIRGQFQVAVANVNYRRVWQ
jgi:hypothetical protein